MKEHETIIASVIAMRGLVEAVVKKYVVELVMFTSRAHALEVAMQLSHTEEERTFLKQAQCDVSLMRQTLDDTLKVLTDMVDASNDLIKELPMGKRLFYQINLKLMIEDMTRPQRVYP